MTVPPSSRSRRRESTSSTAPSGSTRVRKNSMANTAAGQTSAAMRPRANTISHVDNTTFGMIAAADQSGAGPDPNVGFGHPNMTDLPGVSNHHYRGMSSASGHHGRPHVLPKLKIRDGNADVGASMRTAPGLCRLRRRQYGKLALRAWIHHQPLHSFTAQTPRRLLASHLQVLNSIRPTPAILPKATVRLRMTETSPG